MLSILLVTTHKCNLRCKYCYESVSHGGADMTVEDARSAFVWTERLAELRKDDEILFMWFGGEPFAVGMQRIGEMLKIQKEVFVRSAIKVRNVVQTNLTLWDDELIPIIQKSFDNSISVSLDFNPQFRVFQNGQPSNGLVLGNVAKLKAAGVRVGLIGTLTRADIGHERDVYAFYKEINCPFRLNRAHESGNTARAGVEFMSVAEFDEFVIDMFKMLVSDNPPRAPFINYYDVVNALRNGVRQGCRLSPEDGINFTIEPGGVISDWCRFGEALGSYRNLESCTDFCVKGWCMEQPESCAACNYLNVLCNGACEYEKDKSCEESNCGFRTERTRRQLDFVRQHLDSFGIRHCLSSSVGGGEP